MKVNNYFKFCLFKKDDLLGTVTRQNCRSLQVLCLTNRFRQWQIQGDPSWSNFFSFFIQFSPKSYQIIGFLPAPEGLVPSVWEILDLPLGFDVWFLLLRKMFGLVYGQLILYKASFKKSAIHVWNYKYILINDIHTNLDPVVNSCCPSSPGDLTSKAKLLPSTI